VETASLELAPLPLHQRIQLQAEQVLARGIRRIRIVPLFLLPGVHVREDIPQQIAIARQNLGASTTIELCPHLGSHEQIINLLARQLTRLAAQKNIIVCHGSRRGEARQEMETMAKKLKAIAAYWAHGPSLEEQVRHLQAGGSQKIAILPYFLFRGGITDAITAQVHQLQNAYPQLELHLSNPLGATPELAQLIASTSLH
jgi:sirohydrochlorin ferrochelatase